MTAYTLQPSTLTKHEHCLTIALLDAQGIETRGAVLAKAIGGRYAREGRCFYMTEAKARRWELLYRAGFSAERGMFRGEYRWKFTHPARRGGMKVGEATWVARIAQAVPKEAV